MVKPFSTMWRCVGKSYASVVICWGGHMKAPLL